MLKPLFLLSALASAPLKSTWRKVRYEELNKNISKQWCHHDDEGEEWWVYLCVGGGVGVAVEPPPAEPPQVRGGDGGGAGAHPAPVLAAKYNRYLDLHSQFPTGDPWHMYCGMCLFVCVHGSSSRLITNVEGHENTREWCVTKLYLCETVINTVFIFGQLFIVNLIYCGNLANKITRN